MLFLSFYQSQTQWSASALQSNKHCFNRCPLKEKCGFQNTGWHILANSRWAFFLPCIVVEKHHMYWGSAYDVWPCTVTWKGYLIHLNTDLSEHVLLWKNCRCSWLKPANLQNLQKRINYNVFSYCVILLTWTHTLMSFIFSEMCIDFENIWIILNKNRSF